MPAAWEGGMTRHPKLGAVERAGRRFPSCGSCRLLQNLLQIRLRCLWRNPHRAVQVFVHSKKRVSEPPPSEVPRCEVTLGLAEVLHLAAGTPVAVRRNSRERCGDRRSYSRCDEFTTLQSPSHGSSHTKTILSNNDGPATRCNRHCRTPFAGGPIFSR
jgi:hypothetical protein